MRRWLAILVPAWLVLVLCVHWQPVYWDTWTPYLWHRQHDLTLANLREFITDNYVWNNPRLGQLLTLLVFTPGPWAAMIIPLVELALVWLLCALVVGRWPTLRDRDDALLYATIFALLAVCVPEFGPMLFYVPYTGNYLFGLVLCLAFLVPYRFDAESPRDGRWWWAPVLFVVGALAGESNEHTGPAVVVLALLAIAAAWRRRQVRAWMIVGLVGFIAGGLALYFAPGQNIRYQGLAKQASLLGRIAERGVGANARIVGTLFWALWPAVAWLALGAYARWRDRKPLPRGYLVVLVAGAAAAVAFALTLLASPKQGARLYLASVAFACAAIAGWVIPQLQARLRTLAFALAAVVLVYTGARSLYAYHRLGDESGARLAALEAAAPTATAVVPHLVPSTSRWSLKDDLVDEQRRKNLAYWFGIAGIELVK